jgi:integrase
VQDIILPAGKSWRTGNGGEMRRRFQVGSVRKRGRRCPVWEGRYYEPVIVEGKLRKVRRGVILGSRSQMSKSEAKQKLQKLLQSLNEGLHVPRECITFGQLWDKWRKEILPTYRSSTGEFYQRTMERWILPWFREWQLRDIKTIDLQAFINRFQGYSKSALKHIRSTVSVILATAVDWQYVQQNPANRIKLPAGKAVKRATVLTPEQLQTVITNLDEPYRTMVVIDSRTGMRESEVLGLKWDDFDHVRRVVKVQRSFYRGKVNEPKSKQSEREIPYGDAVRQTLCWLANSEHNKGEFLFVAPRGGFFSPQRITRTVFKPLAVRLGLPEFTWRTFRRSLASALHNNGTPLKVQQAILGHTNVGTSLIYTEAELARMRQAIAEFDVLMDANGRTLRSELQNQRVN